MGELPSKLNVQELKEKLMDETESSEIDFIKFAEAYFDELKNQGRRDLPGHFKVLSPILKHSGLQLISQILILHFLHHFIII